jgi:hypothetical protein
VRSRWLTRRAILLTIAVVIWVPGCAVAAWWQVTVAMSGNDLGYLYSVEWPIFAVLGVVGWWQLVHDDPETVRARRLLRARPRLAADGRHVAAAPAAPATASSAAPAPVGTSLAPAASRTPVRVRDDAEDDELTAYNEYLASLATSGARKTWRDPLGSARAGGKRSPRTRASTPAGAGDAAASGDGSGGEP